MWKGTLAHHVSDLVDALDLSPFYAPYEGDGRRNSPYDPRMMVKVLIYAYATGTFSSRKTARKLEEDIAFRMLAAGNFPQHRTLCEFRRRHLKDFQAVFAEVVRLARGMGLAGFGRVSVDGTKVRANASKRKPMSYGRMVKEERRLQAEIRALLKTAEAADEAEDARYGEDARDDELPEELKRREDRLAAIRAAKARLEAGQSAMDDARGRKPGQARNPKGGTPYKREYGEPDEKAQSNFTDPESRIMKTSSEGFQQSYNAQTVVDGDNQVVVATTVTDNASNQGQLIPMVDAVRDAFGETPEQVLADAGYCSEPNLLRTASVNGPRKTIMVDKNPTGPRPGQPRPMPPRPLGHGPSRSEANVRRTPRRARRPSRRRGSGSTRPGPCLSPNTLPCPRNASGSRISRSAG